MVFLLITCRHSFVQRPHAHCIDVPPLHKRMYTVHCCIALPRKRDVTRPRCRIETIEFALRMRTLNKVMAERYMSGRNNVRCKYYRICFGIHLERQFKVKRHHLVSPYRHTHRQISSFPYLFTELMIMIDHHSISSTAQSAAWQHH